MSAWPPRSTHWLLERVLPPGDFRAVLLRDLEEELAARGGSRFWYWRQVLALLPRLLWARWR
jgi:hypothetical protein